MSKSEKVSWNSVSGNTSLNKIVQEAMNRIRKMSKEHGSHEDVIKKLERIQKISDNTTMNIVEKLVTEGEELTQREKEHMKDIITDILQDPSRSKVLTKLMFDKHKDDDTKHLNLDAAVKAPWEGKNELITPVGTPTIAPTKFVVQGNMVTPRRMSLDSIKDKLAVGVYKPTVDDKGVVHLDMFANRFHDKPMLGPQIQDNMEMFKQHYHANQRISVLLVGQKGSGKTMTAEALCNFLLEQGLPVIYVDTDIPAYLLHQLLRDVGRCVVMIDEFDKRYQNTQDNPTAKEQLLSLFSDASLDQVSFILAGNEKWRMSEYLMDRPSRFHFRVEYSGISPIVVLDLCRIAKLPPKVTSVIVRYSSAMDCSYDVVSTVVKLAKDCKSDVDEMIKRACFMNIPNFSETTVRLVYVRSNKGMVSGVRVKQDGKKFEFTVIHECGTEEVVSIPEITNQHFIDRKFIIDNYEFRFALNDSDDTKYNIDDSYSMIGKVTGDQLLSVVIDPGRYRTYELKGNDGESKVVTAKQYHIDNNGKSNQPLSKFSF